MTSTTAVGPLTKLFNVMPNFVRNALGGSESVAKDTLLRSRYRFRDVFHCTAEVVKEEGLSGLFKGLGSAALRSFPTYAVSFQAYEYCLAYFDSLRKENETS